MKYKKPNAELVWKQLEDLLAPRLRLSVIDRTVYAHLLRHSRLEGKLRLRFSILGLGRNIRLSSGPVREAVRRLVAHGALRMVQRSKLGHVVEVRLPGEIRAVRLNRIESRSAARDELHGMQRAERGKGRRRFSPPALSRAPLDRHRTRRPPPRPRRPCLRQTPPFPSSAVGAPEVSPARKGWERYENESQAP